MSKEYIERKWLIHEVCQNPAEAVNERCAQLLDAILEAPAADVEPVRHGEWIPITTPFTTNRRVSRWRCSECREVVYNKQSNYCPKCGTKMDGGNK
jgi:uncharacterized paraquat-inducible protein A